MHVAYAFIAFCLIAATLDSLQWAAIDSLQWAAIPLVLSGHAVVLLSSISHGAGLGVTTRMMKPLVFVGSLQAVVLLASSAVLRQGLGPANEGWFFASVVVVALLIVDYALDWHRTRRWRLPLLGIIYAGLAALLIINTSTRAHDVWLIQQNAARALLTGAHPYDISMPNPYDRTDFYGPGVLRDNQVYGFPYPPLALSLVMPGYLLGDVRWSMLAAHLVLAWSIVAIARRRGFPAGHHVELVPLALFVQPGSLCVIEGAWTDSLFAAAVALLVLACQRSEPSFRRLTLAGVWSMKQYSILLPWTQWRSGGFGWRDFAFAAVFTAGTMIPFFMWNAEATWFSLVEFQFRQPIRPDSYSLNAILLHLGRRPLPTWCSLACVIVVAMWVASRWSAIRTSLPLTTAAVLLTLFVTTNAFINYLWVVTALLAIGIVAGFPGAHPVIGRSAHPEAEI